MEKECKHKFVSIIKKNEELSSLGGIVKIIQKDIVIIYCEKCGKIIVTME